MKIRLARYRDKPGVDLNATCEWDAETIPRRSLSTDGRWHYHAWVEEGEDPHDDGGPYPLIFGESHDQGGPTMYHPDVHVLEIAEKAIEVPEPFVNIAEALYALSEPLIPLDDGNAGSRFIAHLKRMLLCAYALGGGDNTPAYFVRARDQVESSIASLFDEGTGH